MCLLKLFDYCRFSSELKEALFHCTEKKAEAFPQICNAIFSNILHHGLGALGANTASCHKRSRSINKWLNHLAAYLKVRLKPPYRTTVQWATVIVFTYAADESSSTVSNASSCLNQKLGCSNSVAHLHSTADTGGFRNQPHFRIPTPSPKSFVLISLTLMYKVNMVYFLYHCSVLLGISHDRSFS